MNRFGISKQKITGPFEIEDATVTGDTYRNLLIRKVFPRLKSSRLDFSKLGASLNRKYYDYWSCRQGSVNSPARSLNLIPCCFFLQGYIYAKFYATTALDMENFWRIIKLECRRIRSETSAKVRYNLKLRLNYLKNWCSLLHGTIRMDATVPLRIHSSVIYHTTS